MSAVATCQKIRRVQRRICTEISWQATPNLVRAGTEPLAMISDHASIFCSSFKWMCCHGNIDNWARTWSGSSPQEVCVWSLNCSLPLERGVSSNLSQKLHQTSIKSQAQMARTTKEKALGPGASSATQHKRHQCHISSDCGVPVARRGEEREACGGHLLLAVVAGRAFTSFSRSSDCGLKVPWRCELPC